MIRYALAALAALVFALPAGASTRGGPICPADGKTHIKCYLPLPLRMFNCGGSDKKGLCVYTSVTMAARFQNETALFGLRKYAEARPGGSWPEKLAFDIAAVAPAVKWLNYQGKDMAFLRAVIDSGRMLSVSVPGHMLNAVHIDDRWVVFMDNNDVYDERTKADNQLIWLSHQEFQQQYTGWAVVLLSPPPPPQAIYQQQQDLPSKPDWKAPRLVWSCDRRNPSQTFLCKNGVDVGGWDYSSKIWRDYRGGQWSEERQAAPHQPPDWGEVINGKYEVIDFGCDYVAQSVERWSIGGKEVSRAAAFELIGQRCPNCPPNPPKTPTPKQPSPGPGPGPGPGPAPGPIPDDSTKLRVTIVGDALGQVAKDLEGAPELAGWKGKLVVQSYKENDPMLISRGLPATGFHVLVQLPPAGGFDGRVVANWTTYAGAAALAAGLAKLDPSYVPPPPAAPANVTAASAAGMVTVKWEPAAGITWNVYRGDGAGKEGSVPYLKGLAAPTFTEAVPPPGATLAYVVTAVGPGGESAKSAEVVVAMPKATPAAAPPAQAQSDQQAPAIASTGDTGLTEDELIILFSTIVNSIAAGSAGVSATKK